MKKTIIVNIYLLYVIQLSDRVYNVTFPVYVLNMNWDYVRGKKKKGK
jgi:hypothetical protein